MISENILKRRLKIITLLNTTRKPIKFDQQKNETLMKIFDLITSEVAVLADSFKLDCKTSASSTPIFSLLLVSPSNSDITLKSQKLINYPVYNYQ